MFVWLRLDIVRLFLLALPALVAFLFLVGGEGSWVVAVLILAITLLAWGAWQFHHSPVSLGPRFLVFFLAYCLLFSFAAGTEVLSGPRELLAGFERAVPRNFLSLDRWGDWHYLLAPPAPPASDLVVVTFPSFAGQFREDARRNFAFLIQRALNAGARGVALDYFFLQESRSDRLLASLLQRAEQAGVPIVFGYRHEQRDGRIIRRLLPPVLAESVPLERLGHLAGYRESTGLVRMVPVELPGNRGLPSLSWRIASLLPDPHGEIRRPSDGLVQFLPPESGVPVEPFSPDLPLERLRDRFLVVGTASETDRVATPFGEIQGVMVHAYAAHALRTGHFVRRIDHIWTFPLIYFLCYLLVVREARAVSHRRLLLSALGLSLLALVTAVAAMRFALVWIDLAYPLFAIWGLVLLLLLGRSLRTAWQTRRLARKRGAAPTPPAGETTVATQTSEEFDVFLSHNGRDKDDVRPVARALKERGLKPWLDVEQLVPGRPWQQGLEDILRTVKSSAVFLGKSGFGPWEIPEMRVSLSECVKRGMPVIPVLLPGAGKEIDLPLLLTQYTWVDLRSGLTEEGLDRLEWGIRGVRPEP